MAPLPCRQASRSRARLEAREEAVGAQGAHPELDLVPWRIQAVLHVSSQRGDIVLRTNMLTSCRTMPKIQEWQGVPKRRA
jgi:hypothetical protein